MCGSELTVILISVTKLYRNDTPEPIATSVSMLGASFTSDLNPFMKNFWLMTIMIPARSISITETATGLPCRKAGIGKPNIMCPIDTYMRTRRSITDEMRRDLRTGVSLFSSDSSSDPKLLSEDLSLPATDAP